MTMRLYVARSTARRALGAALLASSTLTPGLAQADDFQGLGLLPGGTRTQVFGISADGSTAVGSGDTATFIEGFRWTASGGLTMLGLLPGGSISFANAVNSDGSVIVGFASSSNFANDEAFRWTQSGGMVGLGTLGGNYSSAQGVNGDGSVVVGQSNMANGALEAFRWTQSSGMVGLGFLPGGVNSVANGVSGDGSVVVGSSIAISTYSQAFRWTQNTGMIGLGFLPGDSYSSAYAISADGSVIVGGSRLNSNPDNGQAFRWTQSGGMVGLGTLPGGTFSEASAVNSDGSVVVGTSQSSQAPGGEAFRWTGATGMRSLTALLTASGVNVAGWQLTQASGVSADGNVIVGYGIDPSGQLEAWIAHCTPTCSGLITPAVISQSFAGQSAVGQSVNATIGTGLDTLSQTAIQTGLSQGSHNTPYSAFGYGGYDSDPAATGTLGITVDLPNAMLGGVAVSANYVKTDMVFNGSSKMAGGSGGLFLARVPNAGLQWLVSVDGTTLTGDISRGYLNGSGPASSTGSTTANGYGFTGRVGWTFSNVWPATQVTPFVSYTFSSIRINGYTETSGVFPAQFSGFTDNAQTSRLGADARYTFAPGKWLWGTLAWAHRLDSGKGSEITGTLIGLFSITAQGASVAADWAEITGGVRLPLWQNGAFIASLTASVPENFPTTYAARVGVTQAF